MLDESERPGRSRLLKSVFSREGCFGVPQHKNTVLVDQAPQSRHRKQPCLWMKVDQKIAAEHGVVRSIIIQKIGRDQIPLPELNLGYHRVFQTPRAIAFGVIEVMRAVPRVRIAEGPLAECTSLRGL